MLSEYTTEKINFIKRSLNLISNPELQGSVMDLIEDIESKDAFKGVQERSFCLGYTLGASAGIESNGFMDAMCKLKPSYDALKLEGTI